MSIPLSLLHRLPSPAAHSSLGDLIAQTVTDSVKVNSLLDCLCTTTEPAIHSPEASRPPLSHQDIRVFVSNFVLPSSSGHQALGPNDRIMVVLPTGPENALALLALASYHTCAPVNASCTASELKEDAERLHAKAVVTTKDAEERLELRMLAQELGCEVVYLEGRTSGPAGLFDMSLLNGSRDPSDISRKPTRLHGLHDQSLVLHTSGTSGKKKVVPYTLRSLIVGTSAVIHSWALGPTDVNSEHVLLFIMMEIPSHHFISEHDAAFPCRGHCSQSSRPYNVRRQHNHVLRIRRDRFLESRYRTQSYLVSLSLMPRNAF